ncbi:MAG: ParB/RepB/Spo0J family partition protein [Spirochaetia bacterium]
MFVKKKAPCFYEDFDAGEVYTVYQVGLRVIDVKSIVGTVDKCGELDSKFRYIRRGDWAEYVRRSGIKKATNPFEFFPPISVNRFQGKYYVVDGHRRVAAAIEKKIDFIDAEIQEYVLHESGENNSGFMARKRFESETGITQIHLNQDVNYSFLMEDVLNYTVGSSTKEKAKSWLSEKFVPFCKEIKNSQLDRHYSDLAVGDIYVLVNSFYSDFMGDTPKNVGFSTLISGYLFAHKIKQRRAYRIPVFSFFLRLLHPSNPHRR